MVTVLYAGLTVVRRASRPPGRWVGYTECVWVGNPRVTVRPGLRVADSLGVVAHESVHAAQCSRLGPLRYRWNTQFATSNLALETPAYCAGARARTRVTHDTAFEKATIPIDMLSAMGDAIDSTVMLAALQRECPEFVRGSARPAR